MRRFFLLLLCVGPWACSSGEATRTDPGQLPDSGTVDRTESGVDAPPAVAAVESVFVVPESLESLSSTAWFDHPWPSDFRRTEGGQIRYLGFPNPQEIPLVDSLVSEATTALDGFSPVAAGYLRFAGPIDTASLPTDPDASLLAASSVQIVDVDPKSAERGTRKRVETYLRAEDGVYWRANTLAVYPAKGFPLRPKTTYAIVVTRALRGAAGSPIAPSAELREVLGTQTATGARESLRAKWATAVSEFERAGVARGDVAHLTVFTTTDPTEELFRVAEYVRAKTQAPKAEDGAWSVLYKGNDYDVYGGVYSPSPNFQKGTPPFAKKADGGGWYFDANGDPIVQSTFSPRFALVVPKESKCPMPDGGYPVSLYAHGTGGDYSTVYKNTTGTGPMLARRCIASIGVDQIFHGTREGAASGGSEFEASLFINVDNMVASRTNLRQSAIDVVQQARLVSQGGLVVPASISVTKKAIGFDASRMQFAGHSQGGLNGSLFLAVDGQTKGGVLSGTGAMVTITAMERTTEPKAVDLVRLLLGLTSSESKAELVWEHPALSLLQTLSDVVDPISYMPYLVLSPRAGLAPKNVFLTEGVRADGTGDSYTPPHATEVASVAAGLPRMLPGVYQGAELRWSGMPDVTVPAGGISGNLAGGRVTGGLFQVVPPRNVDGHFAAFYPPYADQMAEFCKAIAETSVGKIVPQTK